MTALPEWMVLPPDGMTAADYDALPEDICRQIEVVDGKIVVSPSPRRSHQMLVDGLSVALRTAARPRFKAASDVDLRLRDIPLLNRRPDIAVFDSSLPDEAVLRPEHCVLVVEVMSPGSVTTDQVDKPAEYAIAGVEHFWRVENCADVSKLTTFRYRLDPTTRTYASVGAHMSKMVVSDPFDFSVDFHDLVW